MKLFIYAFVTPDEKSLKMQAVYDACVAAGIEIPPEVCKHFGYDCENPPLEIHLGSMFGDLNLEHQTALENWSLPHKEMYEINLSKLPPNTTKIRIIECT